MRLSIKLLLEVIITEKVHYDDIYLNIIRWQADIKNLPDKYSILFRESI